MKTLCSVILAMPLAAAELEGTAWYDSEGQLVLVEGADAESAEEPFVAEWRKREIERRERVNYNRPENVNHFHSSGYRDWQWRWLGANIPRNGNSRYGCYSSRTYSGFYQTCPTPYRGGGASVIIRW